LGGEEDQGDHGQGRKKGEVSAQRRENGREEGKGDTRTEKGEKIRNKGEARAMGWYDQQLRGYRVVKRRKEMICRSPLCSRVLPFAIALAVVVLAGCAAKQVVLEAPETGVTLQYKMPKGQILKYDSSQHFIQGLEIQGSKIEVNAYTTYEFSVESAGQQDGNHQLTFTIDAMEVSVNSSEGDVTADTRSAVGKSFKMVLTPRGEELETPGLGGIKYDLGPAGKRGVSSDFEAWFPNLTDKRVKAGDSWTSTDTVNIKEENTDIQLTFESVNKVEGFESIEGFECAKIASDVTGVLSGTGKEGEMDLIMSGTIEGSDTWYFAYREGLYVKMESDATVEGKITAAGDGLMIPMNNVIRVEMTLVK
jgi:hypothetical protein